MVFENVSVFPFVLREKYSTLSYMNLSHVALLKDIVPLDHLAVVNRFPPHPGEFQLFLSNVRLSFCM